MRLRRLWATIPFMGKGRLPQLDGLRAFAVAAVMVHHANFEAVNSLLPLWLGVQLFFVLSGLLITGILLKGTPTKEFIGIFYIRRALRLLPLYFLVIAIMAVFSQQMRDAWAYFVFYGANFWIAANQQWGPAPHFWSLAVEEQFYLIWPFAVLWLPRRSLTWLCVGLIVVAPALRYLMAAQHDFLSFVLLPSSMDGLAYGALIAILGAPHLTRWHALIGALSVAATLAGCWFLPNAIDVTSLALPALTLIVIGASRGFTGVVGATLAHPVTRYLGRISYGLYVIHFPVYVALQHVLPTTRNSIIVAIYIPVTIALASLSWFLLENPINKRRLAAVDAIFPLREITAYPARQPEL